jgi:hypothetical protein
MSGSCHINLSFSGLVVLEKIFKDLTLFLHFYNYLPFEQDLALFEFPSPKDDLYQVSLQFVCWFWRRRS